MKKILTIILFFSVCAISVWYCKSVDYKTQNQLPTTDVEYDSYNESIENTLIRTVRLNDEKGETLSFVCAEGNNSYADVLAQAVEANFTDREIKVLERLINNHPITSDNIYEILGRKIIVYDSGQKVFCTEIYPDTSQNNISSQSENKPYSDGTINYTYNENGKILREIRIHNKNGITIDGYFFYNESGQIEESHINYPYIKQNTDRYYIYNSDGTINKVIVYEEEKLYMIYYFNDGTFFLPDNYSIASSQPSLPGNYYKVEKYRTDDESSKLYLYIVDYFDCEPYYLEDTGVLAYRRQTEHTDVFNSDGSLEAYIEYEYYTTDNLPYGKKTRLSPYADPGESVVEENTYSVDGILLGYCMTYYDIETTERLRIEAFDAQGNLTYKWVN